jgi:hypothetical protein
MSEPYVAKLITMYEGELQKVIECQDPVLSLASSLIASNIGMLRQAYHRCDFEQQLYCVNRIARTLGEVRRTMEEKDAAKRVPDPSISD